MSLRRHLCCRIQYRCEIAYDQRLESTIILKGGSRGRSDVHETRIRNTAYGGRHTDAASTLLHPDGEYESFVDIRKGRDSLNRFLDICSFFIAVGRHRPRLALLDHVRSVVFEHGIEVDPV
jgi:hypothetical protein